MPVTKVQPEELMERLKRVFQQYGYEGASLSILSRATELQRASLYHRFPGGKEEMAQAVLDRVDEEFAEHILEPLRGDREPAEKVTIMARRIGAFYERGKYSCLCETLSLADAPESILRHLKVSYVGWRDAMAKVSQEAGCSASEAKRRSEDALVGIEGGLVVCRVSGDGGPFKRVLADLPRLLTAD